MELPLVDPPARPALAERAGPILDLHQGRWEGQLLQPGDFVVCADEKPSIQARARKRPILPAAPADALKVEHEYERRGALYYLAAWDARRAKVLPLRAQGRHRAVRRVVEQFMSVEPYRSAQRVFVIVDNGSAHRGNAIASEAPGAT